MSPSRNRLVLALAAGALLPAALMAQSSTGSLSGRITVGDSGAPKGGVMVTVVEKGTNLTRKAVSDNDGNWRTPSLPVGDYKIILESAGQSHTLNRTVNLGMDNLVRFKWPKEAAAVVVVEAVASGIDQVNTTSAEIGVNVNSETVADLPIMDRNINSAAVLAPGVQVIQGAQVDPTKKTSTYIVSGDGQGRGTNFNIDGADNNSSDVGGAVLSIPIDAIDQFQVVTNQYKAEFGRSNAGFMNIVTKSGTNDWAGTANWQYTDQNLRARKTDEGTKQASSNNVLSFETAGPIIKDKLFFMVAGEKTKSSSGQYFAPSAIEAYPVLANQPTTIDKMNLYVKVDWNASQNWLVSGHYARYYDDSANQQFPDSASANDNVNPSMLGTNNDSIVNFGAKVTGTLGSLVWESTINYFNYVNTISPANTSYSNNAGSMINNLGASAATTFNAGEDPDAIQNTGVQRREWKNEVTYTLPDHNIKGGADIQKTNYPLEKYFWLTASPWLIYTQPDVTIANVMSPTLPASEVQGFLTHNPYENPPTSFYNYGFYLQDDWTVNANWSIYYGARVDWDTQLNYYSQFNSLYAEMHATNPALAGIGNQAPTDHHYFSPRIQVLYKPDGDDKMTFKAGYGKFVASTIDNVVGFSRSLNGPGNGGAGNNNFISNTNGTAFNQGQQMTLGNETITLPAAFTPYNYMFNVNGLYNAVQNAMNTGLTTANINTGGKSLLASNFVYPTTQTLSLGMTYKFNEKAALDLTLVISNTKNQTTQLVGTDGSSAAVWSPVPGTFGVVAGQKATYNNANYVNGGAYNSGYDNSDSIFYSDQASYSRQLQAKYTYTTSRMSFLATFVAKQSMSTFGGDAGSFNSSGGGDFYGSGALYPWLQGNYRPTAGAENFSGSFAWNYRWETGTKLGILGQWHSGKAYDIFAGGLYATNVASGGYLNDSNPNPWVGTGYGDWNLNLGLRLSQDIKVGKKAVITPYLVIDNLLNNYDYGNNYQASEFNVGADANGNAINTLNSQLGQRLPGFQTNSPRNEAFGIRVVW